MKLFDAPNKTFLMGKQLEIRRFNNEKIVLVGNKEIFQKVSEILNTFNNYIANITDKLEIFD